MNQSPFLLKPQFKYSSMGLANKDQENEMKGQGNVAYK